ncbi:MAG: DUF5060 domain-containing protein [Deinococcus sp.]|nr:DUF5060 domain-containing protein [Deinococcus sp.]
MPRYGIFEQTFTWSSAGYRNPWEQVQLTMTLTSPTGKQVTIGGFYYGPDTWKTRFAPSETGTWSWQATLTNGTQAVDSTGSFTVVDSDWPGFVRPNPTNSFRWMFDSGAPYYPLGIGDCVQDVDHSGSPLDNWGFDGEFRGHAIPEYGWTTDIDTYLGAYSAAGVNLFRWSVDNCAFGLYETIDPTGNVYKVQAGLWGDELVQKLRQHGFRTYMVIFGFQPPFPNDAADPAKMVAVQRYVQYVVDRYSAYVDFWELMNEFPNPPSTISDDWYTQIGQYLRRIDPYQHPISTSWQRPDLAVIDITSPHWYQKEDELASDLVTQEQINHWRSFGKPVIFGEQGNSEQNWDPRSALRLRLRSWTAFFNEGVFIFWNSSFAKDYQGGVASNIYLGPEERAYLRILQDFTRGFDLRASMVPLAVSNPALVRGSALRSPSAYAAYLHAYTDHSNPASGITVTVDLLAGGTATWISPATGEVLGTQNVSAGLQTLPVPAFTTDIALKITTEAPGQHSSTTAAPAQPISGGGWWSGDTHFHSNGCGGNRTPDQMLALMGEADLNVGSALVWGDGYNTDVTYFTGADWPSSTSNRILHYDLEVSAFPSDLMGHFIPLNLRSIDFPRRLYTLPIAQWAKAQGAVTGFAHATAWPAPYTFLHPGIGTVPYELPIDLALGQIDFLETEFLSAELLATEMAEAIPRYRQAQAIFAQRSQEAARLN